MIALPVLVGKTILTQEKTVQISYPYMRGNQGHCPDTQQSSNNLSGEWADPSLPQGPPHHFLKDAQVN